jgi:integrase
MPRPPKNAIAFTDRTLSALKPGTRRLDYMDRTFEGFGLRVFPSGHKTFFVRYRFGHGFRRFTLGEFKRKVTLKNARSMAATIIGRVAGGDDPQDSRRQRRAAPTFEELAATYLEVRAKPRIRARSYQEEVRVIEHDLLPQWRRFPAAEIRRPQVAKLLDSIVARGAPVQANRTRAVVSRIFAFAVEREIVEYNPVAGLRRPSVEQSRQRVLSDDEIRAFWTAWEVENSITSAVFRMLLLSAQRKQEVLRMRWADIQGTWWTIPATAAKNKLAHRVFLTADALALLAAMRPLTGREEWVFASPKRPGHPLSHWLSKAKQRSRARTSIHDWRPHDLRRTAATYMGRMGVSRTAIARVLNHAEKGVTAIYDRSTGEHEVEQALRLWGQRLKSIIHGCEAVDNVVRFG